MRASARRGALAGLALLAGAATAQAQAPHDPLEPVNRRIHGFNRAVQSHLLGPAVEFYLATAPAGLREGVANAAANLGEPVTAVSALLAGEFTLGANAALRFGINSTLGIAGTTDRAAALGLARQPLAVADAVCGWGVPSGPYMVLPLFGPSTLRDATATAATAVALSHTLGTDMALAWSAGTSLVDYAGLHPDLHRIDSQALDPYAVQRSLYLQRRAATCPTDRTPAPDDDEGP